MGVASFEVKYAL